MHLQNILVLSTLSWLLQVAWANLIVNKGTGKRHHSFLRRSGAQFATGIKHDFPFYHTTQELQSELQRLAGQCKSSMTLSNRSESNLSIDFVDLSPHTKSRRTNRIFIVSGEHARELIGPETVLYLIQTLCGLTEMSEQKNVAHLLEQTEFRIVINANPHSRQKAELGEYCLRNNPRGVDLNRNWKTQGTDKSQAFSEPETRILKKLIEEYHPRVFLSLHSGTRGLYMPYAYDMDHIAHRNKARMLSIMRDVDSRHCTCPYGAAGAEVGYPAPGTSIDWAFDTLKVPISFAFEIFGSPYLDEGLTQRWKQKIAKEGDVALLETGHNLGHAHFKDLFNQFHSDFVSVKSLSGASQNAEQEDMFNAREASDCFQNFNPTTGKDYNRTLQNWAAAYIEVAWLSAENL